MNILVKTRHGVCFTSVAGLMKFTDILYEHFKERFLSEQEGKGVIMATDEIEKQATLEADEYLRKTFGFLEKGKHEYDLIAEAYKACYMRHAPQKKPKWLYRLESVNPDNGLWYNLKNEYVWGCKGCKGDAKNLPMGYDPRYHLDGKNWFSSCSKLDDLLHWYSCEDARYLIKNGFQFTKYLARDYHEYNMETTFLMETVLDRKLLSFDDFFNK